MHRALPLTVFIAGLGALLSAQPVFRGHEIFPSEEFATRRAQVFERIGGGVAVLQGTTERGGEEPFRQSNQFFYLTGIVEPRALVLLDGRTRKTTVFLQPADTRRDDRMFGPALAPGEAAARLTGVDAVQPREDFGRIAGTLAGRIIYTPFRAEVLGSQSSGDPSALARSTAEDPWDGRRSREEVFVDKLKAAAPGAELRDLDAMLDAMRAVKSPREIALIRDATQLAGLGIMEAMRDARPGMTEYELQAAAEFVFTKGGAFGPAYFALVATGTNTYFSHYHRNTAVLRDGDLVQFDYAPDYKYYQSDVTRVFPANGRFTPRQREFYTIYLQLYRALMTSIAVHATPAKVVAHRGGEDGRDHGGVPVHRRRDPGCSRAVRGSVPDAHECARTRAQRRHGSARRRRVAGRDPRARPRLHHRAGHAHRGRAPLDPARGHDPHHRHRLREPVGVRARSRSRTSSASWRSQA